MDVPEPPCRRSSARGVLGANSIRQHRGRLSHSRVTFVRDLSHLAAAAFLVHAVVPRIREDSHDDQVEKDLKREIQIDGKAYTLTLSPVGLKLTEKGRRNGREVAWKDLVSGDSEVAVALNASVNESE